MNEFDVQETFLTITGIGATLFPILYTLVAKWWRSDVGRALVFSDVSLACLVDVSLLSYWFGFTVAGHAVTAIVALVAIAAVLRNLALINQQIIQRRKRADPRRDA